MLSSLFNLHLCANTFIHRFRFCMLTAGAKLASDSEGNGPWLFLAFESYYMRKKLELLLNSFETKSKISELLLNSFETKAKYQNVG